MLKHKNNIIVELNVINPEIINDNISFNWMMLYVKYPISADKIIINSIENIVFRKLKSISFLFLSIIIFRQVEEIAIKKYPIIRAKVP